MAKVHYVKRARKSKPKLGIKRGHPYWWLKRRAPGQRNGRKVYFTKPPRPSQIEGNPFRSAILALQESIDDTTEDGLAEAMRNAADDLENMADEQDEKYSNMPESLQQGATGELLEQRAERCREIAEELATAADEVESAIESQDDDEISESERADPREIADGVNWDIE